jgi:hypothetical protein
LVVLLTIWIATAPAPAWAQSAATEAGLGVSSALINLVYGPVKTVYAGCGALFAGFAWIFSAGDSDVARPIINASVRGDYAVTPDHLRGRRDLVFIGRDPSQRTMQDTGF